MSFSFSHRSSSYSESVQIYNHHFLWHMIAGFIYFPLLFPSPFMLKMNVSFVWIILFSGFFVLENVSKQYLRMAVMRVHLIHLWMRSMLLLHISGGKGQCTVFFVFLLILLHGRGNNGGVEWSCRKYENLCDLNMTMLAYGLVVHVLFTKGLRLTL